MQSRRKLDRSRPYGVSVPPAAGVCFHQDHLQFDRDGLEIVREETTETPASSVAGDPPEADPVKRKPGRPRKIF